MDLDLLHIKLTAYALGELDPEQKTEVERILTENQDARDQVIRARTIAKAIKEFLPQSAEDVHPITPEEYRKRERSVGQDTTPSFAQDAPPVGAAGPAAPAAANHPLVWLLALACLGLAAGWLVQWRTSGPAPTQKLVLASEWDAKENLAASLGADLRKTRDALDKELATHAEDSAKNATLEADKARLTTSIAEIESLNQAMEERIEQLTSSMTRSHSAAGTRHRPFASTQAQLLAALPPTRPGETLAHIQNALRDGEWPLSDLVDAGDLVQSLPYAYPAPLPGSKLPVLGCALAVCPWNKDHLLARVTLTAGTEATALSSFNLEFNPAKVSAWRLIGNETDGGGQGTGELKPGASLTVLCEIIPTQDPLPPLLLKRIELLRKSEEAKWAVVEAKDQASLSQARLTSDGLRLDLADLDAQIARTRGAQKPGGRYLPAAPAPTAPAEEWLAVTAVILPPGAAATPVEGLLRGVAQPFPEADADFRLAAAAAAFGLVLRDSPHRGTADLALVETLLKDLPASHEGVQILAPLVGEARAAAVETDAP